MPYDIDTHITTIDTEKIDADYMNSRFDKYLRLLHCDGAVDDLRNAEDELHRSFAVLSQEEQKFANIFLHDIQSGNVVVEDGKTFRDYITEYMARVQSDKIHQVATLFGLDEKLLREIMKSVVNDRNINDGGRFDALKKTADLGKASAYFEARDGKKLSTKMVNIMMENKLYEFILSGDADI